MSVFTCLFSYIHSFISSRSPCIPSFFHQLLPLYSFSLQHFFFLLSISFPFNPIRFRRFHSSSSCLILSKPFIPRHFLPFFLVRPPPPLPFLFFLLVLVPPSHSFHARHSSLPSLSFHLSGYFFNSTLLFRSFLSVLSFFFHLYVISSHISVSFPPISLISPSSRSFSYSLLNFPSISFSSLFPSLSTHKHPFFSLHHPLDKFSGPIHFCPPVVSSHHFQFIVTNFFFVYPSPFTFSVLTFTLSSIVPLLLAFLFLPLFS